jgi:ABC-2 type transport system ATP-binding protein
MTQNSNALVIKNLKKTYSNGFEALKGVDLTIKSGEFFGLLGANGAGKTTMLSIVTGLVTKTAGEVELMGFDIDKDVENAKRNVGIVPQEFNFSIFEKCLDTVVWQAGYYGIDREVAKERAEEIFKNLGLYDKRNEPAKNLSGGMKRRLMIARALIHNPRLLILDEPTAGVDVELRRGMWEYLKKLHSQGVTIILTSHYLEEIEELCDRVAIINKGELITEGKLSDLLEGKDISTFTIEVESTNNFNFEKSKYDITIQDETHLIAKTAKGSDLNQVLNYLIDDTKIKIIGISKEKIRLEDLFINAVTSDNTK